MIILNKDDNGGEAIAIIVDEYETEIKINSYSNSASFFLPTFDPKVLRDIAKQLREEINRLDSVSGKYGELIGEHTAKLRNGYSLQTKIYTNGDERNHLWFNQFLIMPRGRLELTTAILTPEILEQFANESEPFKCSNLKGGV